MTLFVIAFTGCSSKQTHDAPSSSMEPTIPAGSRVTADYAAYQVELPTRFDIVVFRPPYPPDAIFAFRVIGLPGEAIQITTNAILIDRKEISPPDGLQYSPVPSGINETNLSSSEFFLLGDNTLAANDSRYFGPIDRTNILAKVVRIEQ